MSLTFFASPSLPQELREHLPKADEDARINVERLNGNPRLQTLRRQLAEVVTPKVPQQAKIQRLRYLAGEYSAEAAKHAACAKGCSHCCNIGVTVSRAEAKLIAKQTRRAMAEPAATSRVGEPPKTEFFGVACTFLIAGRCSIFASRPLTCRALVNMDNVDLLCRLVPGEMIPVPYLNTTEFQGVFVALSEGEDFADVREWFPADKP